MKGNDVNILLVEDDEIDVMVIKRAFKKLDIKNKLFIARDGLEALSILRGNGNGSALRPPYMILLDLNMPRMNGFEFLKELRSDPTLEKSVVFVLTTSSSEEDILKSYDQYVAGYIVKKDIEGGFVKAIEMLKSYWNIVEFPS